MFVNYDIRASLTFDRCVAAVSLAVLIYGITSWCLIRKFRQFKNYVFLNAILANFLRIFMNSVIVPVFIDPSFSSFGHPTIACQVVIYYIGSVQSYWLLVICCIFYVDIVKVFKGKTERRYLKSTIFAWGVPMLTTPFSIYLLPELASPEICHTVRILIILLPIFVNVIIYVITVFSLFCCSAGSVGTATSNWRRFYIATLIFLFCDFIFLSAAVLTQFFDVTFLVTSVMSDFQVIVLDIFFIFLRINRELWREYSMKRKKMSQHSTATPTTTLNDKPNF